MADRATVLGEAFGLACAAVGELSLIMAKGSGLTRTKLRPIQGKLERAAQLLGELLQHE